MLAPTFGAPDNDVVILQCRYRWPEGWTLIVTTRPSGALGPEAWRAETYAGMALDELEEALAAASWVALHPRAEWAPSLLGADARD